MPLTIQTENRKQITLRITNADDQMKISVVDNGVGVPAENLERESSTVALRRRRKVTVFIFHSGALTAKEMGGTLTAFRENGRGASFTLELPIGKNDQ